MHNYLKLDSSSFKALNLLPDRSNEQSIIKTSSIYGLLNQCCTTQGQRLLMQWIKQPLIDLNKLGIKMKTIVLVKIKRYFNYFCPFIIEERLNIVEILANDSVLRESLLENYLKKMPDLQKIEWKFIKNKATLQVK